MKTGVFREPFVDMFSAENPSIEQRWISHVQGVCRFKGGWIISRNGEKHGTLLGNNCQGPLDKQDDIDEGGFTHGHYFPDSHVGGIDSDKFMVCAGTYDKNGNDGSLFLGHGYSVEYGRCYPLAFRPYAVGMICLGDVYDESEKDVFLVAIIGDGDGKVIRWFRIYEAGGDEIDQWHLDKKIGPRNNICLQKREDGLYLFTMRNHICHDEVDKWLVNYDGKTVKTKHKGRYTRRCGLCSVRFGATIEHWDNEDYLIRTTRNIVNDELRMRRDKILWQPV